MEYIYRQAKPDDLAAIIALDQSANPHPWGEKLVAQTIEQSSRFNLIVLDQSQNLCGWLTASQVLDEAELELIMVAPQARRQGLAEGLMQVWLKHILPIPVNLCLLEVRESNHSALSLYKKLGFTQVGIRKNYYVADSGKESAVLMNLTLTKD